MIAIIDYGAGNLRSVANAFESLGARPVLTQDPAVLKDARAIVLPGVGAFGDGMARLRSLGIIPALEDEVLGKKKPYLGICLGMQFLGTESHELGTHRGLGWIDSPVERLVPDGSQFRIPHIGWNDLLMSSPSLLFEGLESSPSFYFVHSYHVVPRTSTAARVTSTCWHGTKVTASLEKGNVFGVQFHPEKSQKNGLKLLENFLKVA